MVTFVQQGLLRSHTITVLPTLALLVRTVRIQWQLHVQLEHGSQSLALVAVRPVSRSQLVGTLTWQEQQVMLIRSVYLDITV
jgi:hypothetical protein